MVTAIILAGGLGTRLSPLTDTTPKPLLPIKGRPIIEHAIENFKKHGITDIVLSIGYKADTIKEYFKDGKILGVKIRYCIDKEPLGTGGAIKEASKDTKGTFVAINGDNLADFDWTGMLAEHRKTSAKITLALCPVEDVTQYGIAKLDGKKIVEFVEKPTKAEAPSNLNNAGGYVMESEALAVLPEGKSSIERDCFEKLAKKGIVYSFTHKGQWFPTDTMEKYIFAEKNFVPFSKEARLKILVTGGAGFIGSHIVEHFHNSADVVVLDNFSTGSRKNLDGLKCKIIEGSITDYAVVTKSVEGCDYVFHLAAFISVPESIKNPQECIAVNVGGTENVLRASLKAGVKKVVIASSCAVYGDSAVLPKKEDMKPETKSPYAESKLRAEELCVEYGAKGLKTCALRFFNVYGPRQDPKSPYAAVIPIFIERAVQNKDITIFGDGKQTRDFIYVKDVVQAAILASESLGGVYNVGTGVETSLNMLAKNIISLAKSKSKINHVNAREGDILRSYGDISKLNSDGFAPRFNLAAGLEETIGWMKR